MRLRILKTNLATMRGFEKTNSIKMIPKLLPYKSYSEARQRAYKLIHDVRRHKKIYKLYKFNVKLIGSQKRRCVIQDNNGKYDLDYQIVLTNNCKGLDPTEIKKAFLRAFTDSANNNEKVEDSTTVVTVRCSKNNEPFDAHQEKFSFDFVIIHPEEDKRIRRNGQSKYTWAELPSKNTYIYERFNRLDGNIQRKLLEECVIPKVIEEKKKHESIKKPSIDIFYEGVNNYYNKYIK